MLQGHDRRKHVRHAVLLPCRVEGASTHGGTMHVTDLSWGGCFVATIVPAEAGAHVTLRAKVAGVDVLLTGCVVHVKPERGFAVEFVNLSSDTRAHLDHFFAQALTTLA